MSSAWLHAWLPACLGLTWGRNRSGADLVSIFCLTANKNIYTPFLYMRVLPNLGNLTSRRLDTIHKKSSVIFIQETSLNDRPLVKTQYSFGFDSRKRYGTHCVTLYILDPKIHTRSPIVSLYRQLLKVAHRDRRQCIQLLL